MSQDHRAMFCHRPGAWLVPAPVQKRNHRPQRARHEHLRVHVITKHRRPNRLDTAIAVALLGPRDDERHGDINNSGPPSSTKRVAF